MWSRFLAEIKDLGHDLAPDGDLWYRGVANESFKLIPSLFRYRHGHVQEAKIFDDYVRIAPIAGQHRPSDWQYLFDMQHVGIPTRLLDWTEVLGVAVFFALGDPPRDDTNAAVWLLSPHRLNQKASGSDDVPVLLDDRALDYRKLYLKNDPTRPFFPKAVLPPLQSPRITAQRGRFTVHGNELLPVEEICSEAVRKVILPASARDEAESFLEQAGISVFSMFPDIYGAVPYIKRLLSPL